MHDIARAEQIVRAVLTAAKERDAEAVLAIEIVLGPLTMLNPEQLQFWISELLRDTRGEGAEVTIEESSASIECGECGYSGAVGVEDNPIYHLLAFTPSCPECGSDDVHINAGDECIVRSVRIRQ